MSVMERETGDFILSLDGFGAARDAWHGTVAFLRYHGIDQIAYGYGRRAGRADMTPEVVFLDTYQGWFNNRYFSRCWVEHDPMLHHCMKTLTPMVVETDRNIWEDDPETGQLLSEMRACGARCGIVFPFAGGRFPVAGMSLFSSLPSAEFERLLASHGKSLQIAATYAHMRMQTLLGAELADAFQLTQRQRQCLGLVASGKSSKEIGLLLGISHRVVDEHVADAARRLNARKRSEAVDRARMLGLLDS